MNQSPIPAAVPGPVISPLRTNPNDVTPGGQVQDQGAPQQNTNVASSNTNLVANSTTTFYTVPAGKTLVLTSCIVSGSTAANQQFFTLKQGATDVAAVSLSQNTSEDLCANGPITFAAGTAVKGTVGSGSPTLSCKISGYLVDPTTYPAPTTAPLPATAALG